MECVNRDSNADINIRRSGLLKTRPRDLMRANLVGQALVLAACMEKLKPIAVSWSKIGPRDADKWVCLFAFHFRRTCLFQ